MTDKELDKLLLSSDSEFYNTIPFRSRDFNKWMVSNGHRGRRPKFKSGSPFSHKSSLAAIVNKFYDYLIEESLEYPIHIPARGFGSLNIYETKRLNGKPRMILNPDGSYKEVVDDYLVSYPAHTVRYRRTSFGKFSPYLTYHIGRKRFKGILRKIAVKYPKGKFYAFK